MGLLRWERKWLARNLVVRVFGHAYRAYLLKHVAHISIQDNQASASAWSRMSDIARQIVPSRHDRGEFHIPMVGHYVA